MHEESTVEADSWDYVIIGGGSSGCVLANRLSADPALRVLLLEAGGSDAHPFSRIPAATGLAIGSRRMNWFFSAEPDPSRAGRIEMWPAGKLLGGGSSINGMMFVRGNRWDYDHWESLGNPGWGYAGVLPYFRRLEHNERGADEYRGQGGPQHVSEVRISHPLTDAFVEGMQELGVARNPDLNGASQEGVDYCQVSQRRGRRHSTAAAYLDPVRDRPNLAIRLHAVAERVELDGRRAVGVRYRHGTELRVARVRRGVVIAAGAMVSPKLLMLSGIGPAAELSRHGIAVRHELPGVGSSLQEHPGIIVSPHVNVPTLTSDLGPLAILREGWRYLNGGRGALSFPVGHAHAFVRTRDGLPAPNVQIIFSPSAFDHHEKGATPYTRPAITLAVGLCRVRSRGRIGLRSANPADPPVIDYSLLSDDEDVAQLVEGVRFARRVFSTRAFGRYFRDERKPGAEFDSHAALVDVVRTTSFLMYHPCCSCRMGPGRDAVVDAGLRVRGLEGLWVADASVMPTVPAGNINATCIMIGEKAADLIAARQQQPETLDESA
jgi:choline dehydrogenase